MEPPNQAERVALLLAFGHEWQSPDGQQHRIYIDNLADIYGLKTETNENGYITSATIDGLPIPNAQAFYLQKTLQKGKLYYDFADEGIYGKDVQNIFDELMQKLIQRMANLATQQQSVNQNTSTK